MIVVGVCQSHRAQGTRLLGAEARGRNGSLRLASDTRFLSLSAAHPCPCPLCGHDMAGGEHDHADFDAVCGVCCQDCP